jgi:signal transduction histidine kinase
MADATLAVAAFGLLLGIAAAGGLGEQGPGARGLDTLGIALVAAATLPLAARRVAPLPVHLAVSAATVTLWSLDYRTDIPVGPLVAVYTLGSIYGGAGWPRRVPAMLAVAALVPAAALVYLSEGFAFTEVLLPEVLVWTLLLAGVWIAGDLTRLRRERMADLAERARRTEHEAERERRIAAAEERTRIARELHDSAGHAINVILVQAGAARLLHERDPAGSRRAIATIEEVARSTIGDIDRLVRALREDAGTDPVPADPGAIEELVERHRTGGLRIDSEVLGPRRTLPRSVAWAAYRILQEALTNAARHGGGSARVDVQFGQSALEITVTNPAGLDGPASTGGHGIVGMRERAVLLGGSLAADRAGGRFRLYARLPYAEAT